MPATTISLFDVNCWIGYWPFQRMATRSASELCDHLAGYAISRACVSHFGAVFDADTDSYNRELLKACSRESRILPVPVLNPAISDWSRTLDEYCRTTEIRAVRILPSFHNYDLLDDSVARLIEELRTRRIQLLIQMRMEDERNAFHGLKVEAPALESVIELGTRHPNTSFVCLCAYLREAQALGVKTNNVCVDVSFAEWLFSIEELRKALPTERILFGSHTPLLYTRANVMKLRDAQISDSEKERIGRDNAVRLLRFEPSKAERGR